MKSAINQAIQRCGTILYNQKNRSKVVFLRANVAFLYVCTAQYQLERNNWIISIQNEKYNFL